MASKTSPCAACKFLRRKCSEECVFAPYFPPKDREKFENFRSLHRVFGESNLRKILNELHPDQRQDAINALIFEAEALILDPVHGSVGLISVLYLYHLKLQQDFAVAKEELADYMRPGAGVIPPSMMREPNLSQQHQPQDFVASEVQRMAANRGYQPQDIIASEVQRMGTNRGYQQGMSNGYEMVKDGSVTAIGFNQMDQDASGSRANRGRTVFDQDYVASEAQRMAAIVKNGWVTDTGFNQMDVNDQGASGSRANRGRPLSDQDFVAAMTFDRGDQQDWSVTARGFNQMDVNDQGATSGSMSKPNLALGSFGDSYCMGQYMEQDHIDHDQLRKPTHDSAYITRRSKANEGRTVSDEDYVGSTSGPFLPLGSFGDPCKLGQDIEQCHIIHDQFQSPDITFW